MSESLVSEILVTTPAFIPIPNRDASASIAGFVYQVTVTISRWLTLTDGQILELECGEDIDLFSNELNTALVQEHEEQARILEQIKLRVDTLTLRSSSAVCAVANLFLHRENNPGLDLKLLYTTNARVGKENNYKMPKKLTGIEAWNAITAGRLTGPVQDEVLGMIRKILLGAPRPQGISQEDYSKFQRFLKRANRAELLDLVQRVEWSTEAPEMSALHERTIRLLLAAGHAPTQDVAEQQYRRLFHHVFHLLTKTGRKSLLIQGLTDVLAMQPLDPQSSALLAALNSLLSPLLSGVTITLDRLVEGQTRLQAAINKLKSTSCWLVDNTFVAEARADVERNMPSLYERPGATTLRHIVAGQDVRRRVTGQLIHSLEAKKDASGMQFQLIRAKGGNGKSSFLWRIAYELQQRGAYVLLAREGQSPDYDTLRDVCELAGKERSTRWRRVYLLLDNAYRDHALLLRHLEQRPIDNLTVIATSRFEEVHARSPHPGSPLIKGQTDLSGLSPEEAYDLVKRVSALGMIGPDEASEIVKTGIAENELLLVMVARLTGIGQLAAYTQERLTAMNDGTDPSTQSSSGWTAFLHAYYTIAVCHAWGAPVPHAILTVLTDWEPRLIQSAFCVPGSSEPTNRAIEYLQIDSGPSWRTDHELIAAATVQQLCDPNQAPIDRLTSILVKLGSVVGEAKYQAAASFLASRLLRRVAQDPDLLFPDDPPGPGIKPLRPVLDTFVVTREPPTKAHAELARALSTVPLANSLRALIETTTAEDAAEHYITGLLQLCLWQETERIANVALSRPNVAPFTRARIMASRGLMFEQIYQYDNAVQDYSDVLTSYPEEPDVLMARGRAYMELGHHEDALADFSISLKLRPDHPDTLINRGVLYSNTDRPQEALRDFRRVLELRSDDPLALTNTGVAYNFLEQFEEALQAHTAALAATPNDARTLSNRAATYHAYGSHLARNDRDEEAQRCFELGLADANRSIEMHPDDPEALAIRGMLLAELGDHGPAIEDYDCSLRIRANDPRTLSNRGQSYFAQKRYDLALRDLSGSLELRPDHPHTLYHRGQAYQKTYEHGKAIQDFTSALEALVRHEFKGVHERLRVGAHFYRGRSYYELAHYNEALSDFLSVTGTAPAALGLEGWLGLTYAHLGKMKQAEAEVRKLEDIDSDHAFTRYTLACLNCLQGDPESALTNLTLAIQRNGEFRDTARTDRDLDCIGHDPRFIELIKPQE